jgi:prophage regulatory protein
MTDKGILRMKPTTVYTGVGRSSIYEKLNPNSKYFDPTFPKPIKLGTRAVGFRLSELQQWVESRERAA